MLVTRQQSVMYRSDSISRLGSFVKLPSYWKLILLLIFYLKIAQNTEWFPNKKVFYWILAQARDRVDTVHGRGSYLRHCITRFTLLTDHWQGWAGHDVVGGGCHDVLQEVRTDTHYSRSYSLLHTHLTLAQQLQKWCGQREIYQPVVLKLE